MSKPRSVSRDATTLRKPVRADQLETEKVPTLTLLAHPDGRRVGERAVLTSLLSRRPQAVQRLEPDFGSPAGGPVRPLDDPYVSRSPIELHPQRGGGLTIDPRSTSTPVEIDGATPEGVVTVSAKHLDAGVVLLLAGRVALLLHRIEAPQNLPSFGLVGESSAVVRLRGEIQRLASRSHTVLLRGETGTGKELVARALHDAGPRKHGPYQAVNFGAIPPSLAASELFGSTRGAFTGAGGGRTGYFQLADGGTLFLDEIAAAPHEVQSALLRVLETGEIQAVGAGKTRTVDARVVAATDADLESAIREETFQTALLHRLGAYEIRIPPLRERRDDVGRLFFHFLRQELERENRLDKLQGDPESERPWVPGDLLARLALYDWPGNVRQLKNVVSRLVLDYLDAPEIGLSPSLKKLLETPAIPDGSRSGPDPPSAPSSRPKARYRDVYEVDESEIRDALRRFDWEPGRAAAALGVARSSLYKRMKLLGLPVAADLERPEIEEALNATDGDTRKAAERLEVSEQGLKMRLKAIGTSG